jgi:hypothetical protein
VGWAYGTYGISYRPLSGEIEQIYGPVITYGVTKEQESKCAGGLGDV